MYNVFNMYKAASKGVATFLRPDENTLADH